MHPFGRSGVARRPLPAVLMVAFKGLVPGATASQLATDGDGFDALEEQVHGCVPQGVFGIIRL